MIPHLLIRCPQKLYRHDTEFVFCGFELYLKPLKNVQGLDKIGEVISLLFTLDLKVIHIDLHVVADQVPEYMVDQALVGSPRIFQAERHHPIAVSSLICIKGSLLFITGVHVNLIVY